MLKYIFGCLLLLIIISLWYPFGANAQSISFIRLSDLSIDLFPQVQAYLSIRDDQGNTIHELTSNQVKIVENGTPVSVSAFKEIQNGVQLIIAINPGGTFGIRNSQGISRYDYIKEALRNWAESRQGSTIDDLSLTIKGGPEISHVNDSNEWIKALAMDQVDARNAEPSLDSLFKAIPVVSDLTPRPGMGRAILFITPPLEGQENISIENILAQTKPNEIPINIWMVASAGTYSAQSLEFLQQISAQTGGKMFTYTGEEELPNPEIYFEPLRSVYSITYLSKIKESGNQEVFAQINIDGQQISSNSQNFNLDILPPSPAFVSPPIEINRVLTPIDIEQTTDSPNEFNGEPSEYIFQVIFDFPDGNKRDIENSTLIVNGEVVDENSEAPYDQFVWDIRQYETNSLNVIQVKATDVLGLTGTSIEIPVEITVNQIRTNRDLEIFNMRIPVLLGAGIVIGFGLIFLILVWGRRLNPSTIKISIQQPQRIFRVKSSTDHQSKYPSDLSPRWIRQLKWKNKGNLTEPEALLIPLSSSNPSFSTIPIQVIDHPIIIGSDPEQASIVFKEASIDPQHTMIIREKEGVYKIIDQSSIAGTWVNYSLVQQDGRQLEHGDQIHIGRFGFIFSMRNAKITKRITIDPPLVDPIVENLDQTNESSQLSPRKKQVDLN